MSEEERNEQVCGVDGRKEKGLDVDDGMHQFTCDLTWWRRGQSVIRGGDREETSW